MQKKVFLENVCLRTKFDLRLKKKTKKCLGQFQLFLCRLEKMSVIQFPYMGIK